MDDDEILGYTPDQFTRGSIRKLVFHRFLTFDHVVVQAGPHLNVIIGPNGSGKSTIICGICLVSGGTPKVLGRSDNVGNYISHGKLDGWVEMNLHDPDAEEGVVCFKVVIRKPNNAQYYIDGRNVTKTAVREAIAKYNIQVDNPCVFLAQDKVKSFAEQGPEQLLWNTEKAGPEELEQLHNELKAKSEKGASVEVLKKEQEEKLKRIRESIDRVRPLAENYKERRRRNNHLQAFKDKVSYLEAKDANERYVQRKAATAVVQGRIDKVKSEMRGIEREMEKARAEIQKVDLGRLSTRLNQLKQTFATKSQNIGDCFDDDSLQSARRDFAALQKQFDNWERDLNHGIKLRDQAYEAWEQAKAVPIDDTATQMKKQELDEVMKKYRQEELEINIDRRDFLTKKREIEFRLQRSQQSMKDKIMQLSRMAKNHDIVNAYEYYCTHRDEFRLPVYIPFVSVEINDANLIYFNNVMGTKDLAMFIFGCPEDEKQLTERKGFRINSTVVDFQNLPDYSATISPELRNLGFHDYIINMFKAPPPIKAYLNNVYGLSVLPIGGDRVDQDSENIANNYRDIRVFLTNRSRIQSLGSYYDANRFTIKRTNLRTRGPLTQINTVPTESQSTKELDDINAKLRALDDRQRRNTGLVQQKERLDREYQDLRNRNMAILNEIETKKMNYEKCVRSLGYKQENKPDIEQARAALEEREKVSRMRLPDEFHKLVQMSNDYYKVIKDCVISEANVCRHRAKYNRLRDRNQELEWSLREDKSEYHVCKTEEDAVKAELSEKLKDFRQNVDISHVDETKLSPDEKDSLKDLLKRFIKYKVPDTVDECNEEIANEEVRNEVAQLQGTIKDVKKLAELEQDEIAMAAELEKSQNTIDNWETDMTALLERWIHPLRELIERINVNFSTFFAKIKCAGQVVLSEPEDKLKINDYGIDILVKFRSYNSMRKLTGQSQSGGERSVSTMLYLMALQELCPVPFRCVDEINQGMDPTNERLVFNMMVDLISGDGHLGKTQYFLLTPKLLPGLNYTEKVAIQIIQNTHFMSPGAPLAVYKDREILAG
uniref:Structural maintenance of chromosomes protein 5 n=1 Tax=Panagrellus redivivus TaxID=6233 RepID=A0A7E4ZZ67_PANRE